MSLAVFDVPVDIEADQDNYYPNDNRVKRSHYCPYFFPVGAEQITGERKCGTPDKRPGECVNHEFADAHFPDTGGQTDKSSDHGHQPGKEDRPIAVLLKPLVGFVQVMWCDENVFAVFVEERPPAFSSDPIRRQ